MVGLREGPRRAEKNRPTHYRFSSEWARVEPKPGVYDEKAVRGYVEMARRLKALGIEPVVCLWHFTFPDLLYDKKHPGQSNWLHPQVRERWNAYVEKMVRATSPYVKYYAPQNEPNGQITAYLVGQWPPAMTLAVGHYWKAIEASTGMLLNAAARIKAIKPSGKVVSVEALPWWQRAPHDPGGLIYNTMIHGNIDHLDRVYDVCDILCINYYYSQAPGPISLLAGPSMRSRHFTMMGWRIDPGGRYKEIQRVATRYGKPMMITENGIATSNDSKREWCMQNHLAVGRAIRDGLRRAGLLRMVAGRQLRVALRIQGDLRPCENGPRHESRILKPFADKFAEIIRSPSTVGSVGGIQP